MATKVEKEVNEVAELNPDQKITIRNISSSLTGFRNSDNTGDITISPKGSVRLPRGEVLAQIQRGQNRLLLGEDGKGSHATLYIEDAPTRIEAGFESEDGKVKQVILTEAVVKELFAKKQQDFEKSFPEVVVTTFEKDAVMEIARKLGINDYRKIRFAEQYTGYQF